MSIKRLDTYTAVCDWPDCGADVMDPTDYSGWGEIEHLNDTLDDWGWLRGLDGQHYCDKHPTAWASDVAEGIGGELPTDRYLLIHDGDTDNPDDDGKVSLVGGMDAATEGSDLLDVRPDAATPLGRQSPVPDATKRGGQVNTYVEHVAKIHEAYRHLVMDTPEDQAIHAQLVAQADRSLALARAVVTPPTHPGNTP